VCYALNLEGDGFHLDLVDKNGRPKGRSRHFGFQDIKAVFHVKRYTDEVGGPAEVDTLAEPPQGAALVVEFQDGELLEGHCLRTYRAAAPRFYLVPDDPESNNITVLVERSAVRTVHSPEGFKLKWQEEVDTFLRQHRGSGFSKPELMGDFFFSRHDYGRAMRQYRYAFESDSGNLRIARKMVAAEYNIGIRYLRHHEYDRALHCMQEVLKADPGNARAREKVEKISAFLARQGEAPQADSSDPM
jgi:tetratricopeptide (TPR) repeat protein